MTLPWIVAPRQNPPRRIGTPASGIIEIPVLGGLTVDEVRLIVELADDGGTAYIRGAQLAEVIAQAEKISIVEAFAIIRDRAGVTVTTDQAAAIRLRYAAQIAEVFEVFDAVERLYSDATIVAIVRERLNLPDWTIPHGFPRVLRDGILQLIRDEEAAEKIPADEITEDSLGKPPEASGDPSEPTGEPSSGASPAPTRPSSGGKRSGGNSAQP